MITPNGTPLFVDLRTPTEDIHTGFRTQSRAIVVGADHAAEQRARVAEQQLAAAQGVVAAYENRLSEVEVLLADEQQRHAVTQALYEHELTEVLRLVKLHADASQRAAEATSQLAWMMRVLGLVGAENTALRRTARDGDTRVVDDPDAGGGR